MPIAFAPNASINVQIKHILSTYLASALFTDAIGVITLVTLGIKQVNYSGFHG